MCHYCGRPDKAVMDSMREDTHHFSEAMTEAKRYILYNQHLSAVDKVAICEFVKREVMDGVAVKGRHITDDEPV